MLIVRLESLRLGYFSEIKCSVVLCFGKGQEKSSDKLAWCFQGGRHLY